MNLQQFQYVLAVAENRHFELAAQKCFITQSTLSTMISKFEDEIGITIFDRKKKPVNITKEGEALINQIKMISREIDHLDELSREIKGEIKGSLTISLIPTIAPSLLPLFIQNFAAKFPDLNIEVKEQTTAEIIRQLKSRELDIGIISTPVKERDILEYDLYDEPFVFYDAGHSGKDSVSIRQLDMDTLCLLEEGHCMRTQIISLCDAHKKNIKNKLNFEYKAGSIDSLLRFVNANDASTLLPYLSTLDLSQMEKMNISQFSNPVPFRSVGLVVHRHFVKKRILKMLREEILNKVLKLLPEKEIKGEKLVPV
jgi:LysR family hydrogen peroxide-inducible transcriptional activator